MCTATTLGDGWTVWESCGRAATVRVEGAWAVRVSFAYQGRAYGTDEVFARLADAEDRAIDFARTGR